MYDHRHHDPYFRQQSQVSADREKKDGSDKRNLPSKEKSAEQHPQPNMLVDQISYN